MAVNVSWSGKLVGHGSSASAFARAVAVADFFVAKVGLELLGRGAVLDVAGGTGLLSLALALRQLSCTTVDPRSSGSELLTAKTWTFNRRFSWFCMAFACFCMVSSLFFKDLSLILLDFHGFQAVLSRFSRASKGFSMRLACQGCGCLPSSARKLARKTQSWALPLGSNHRPRTASRP